MEPRLRSPLAGIATAVALIFLFLPLAVVILFSFHRTASLSFPFTGFSFRWYREVFGSQEFLDAVRNSLTVAVVVAVSTFLLGTLAAYGLSRGSPRLRGPLALLFFLPITLPGLLLGISLLVFFARLDVSLSLVTVTIGHLVFVFPYFFVIAIGALDRLDPGLEEASADLGADSWETFRRVTFPQVWPILLGAGILAFVLSFDEFVITFFVVGSDATLPMFIWSGLRRTIDPTINTISTILLAITLLMFTVGFWAALRARRRGQSVDIPLGTM